MLLIILSFIIYLTIQHPHVMLTLLRLSIGIITALIAIVRKLYSLYQSVAKERL
jgi:hypothetical protein